MIFYALGLATVICGLISGLGHARAPMYYVGILMAASTAGLATIEAVSIRDVLDDTAQSILGPGIPLILAGSVVGLVAGLIGGLASRPES